MIYATAYLTNRQAVFPAMHLPVITGLLNDTPDSVTALAGGRNSRIYKITMPNGEIYAAKFYHHHAADQRDRLTTEYNCLEFLKAHHVNTVPAPIARNVKQNCAIYEFIPGQILPSEMILADDVDALVFFLKTLDTLKHQAPDNLFSPASEACFCINDIKTNLESRFNVLSGINPAESDVHSKLCDFLFKELMPFYNRLEHGLLPKGISSTRDAQEKTLSPSDFGFHNALKTDDGVWHFLDFEYFGWDDPAKMICDFLLHPAMDLANDLRQHFLSRILSVIEYDPFITNRIQYVFPFFALKWCTILLNEFVPVHFARRRFAHNLRERADTLKKQLLKAKQMLTIAKDAQYEFPYDI